MSRLSELIAELCPDGVEYKALGEVIVPEFGIRITKKKDAGTLYPVYGGGGESFRTDAFNREDRIVVSRFAMSETCVRRVSGKFWLLDSGLTYSVIDGISSGEYVGQWLFANQRSIYACSSQSAQRNLITDKFLQLKIPVPPIEVQREIVRVLDSFQELDDVLTAEIESREKQFDTYLSTLMESLAGAVPRVKLGSQMTIVRGASPRPIKRYLTDASDGIHWIKIGDVGVGGKFVTDTAECVTPAGAAKSRFLRRGCLILSNSMSFGRPYILDIDGCIHDGWLAMSGYESSYDRDFLYYLLRSDGVQTAWNMAASTSTVRNLNADIVRDTLVPLPSINQQLDIVGVLDGFMALNDALRSEREARRKQFDYYRDKLLDFPEKVTT